MSLKFAKVTHHYQSKEEDELSLRKGDIIEVLKKVEDGWYLILVRIHDDKYIDHTQGLYKENMGLFPSNFLKEITGEKFNRIRDEYIEIEKNEEKVEEMEQGTQTEEIK